MMEAVIGLIGVLVGGVIAVSREAVSSYLERRRNGSYAAMRIVGVLDQFIETCVDVVSDDGTVLGQPAGRTKDGEEYFVAQVELPNELSFSDDIEWKSIGNELMYRVLALPSKLKHANRYIDASAEHAFPPDYDELFEARHRSYAELGLEALGLAGDVRKEFHIPIQSRPAWNPDWDAKIFFLDKIRSIEERSAERYEFFSNLLGKAENEA